MCAHLTISAIAPTVFSIATVVSGLSKVQLVSVV